MTARLAGVLALTALACGCAGGDEAGVTIYLPQRLGPEGPPGQLARVLMPVDRERRQALAAPLQAVQELRVGPSPDERARGFTAPVGPATRVRAVEVAGHTATVDLAGRRPSIFGSAAIVYSLTEFDGIEVVRLRLDGRPCCVYTHAGRPIARQTRRLYRGWSGEPCSARTQPDSPRCRADG